LTSIIRERQRQPGRTKFLGKVVEHEKVMRHPIPVNGVRGPVKPLCERRSGLFQQEWAQNLTSAGAF
jgi:hypothetical protein